MNFTIYKTNTGEIVQSGECVDSDFDLQYIPEDCSIIQLESNPELQYIQNNIAINFPSKPEYEATFDYSIKQWVPNSTYQIAIVSAKRNQLLYGSDWTQIPNNPLTAEQQATWATYRQELRDITSQSGYPFNIIWPTSPQG